MKRNKGITLITLVITIILLIILAGVVINLTLGENGLFNKANEAKDETLKQAATEKINLKITTAQIDTYSKEQRMPTLQELANNFCEDEEIEYVELESKQLASLDKIEIGANDSFFTKLKEYPYEFEINSSLQLASIDGIKVATNEGTITVPKKEYEDLKSTVGQIRCGEVTLGVVGATARKQVTVIFEQPMQNDKYAVAVERVNDASDWPNVEWIVKNRTVNGFVIDAYNVYSRATGSIVLSYLVIPYNEYTAEED